MEVSVSHVPSGSCCVVPVCDGATVHDLKIAALRLLLRAQCSDADTAAEAGKLCLRLKGSDGDADAGPDGQLAPDATPLSETCIEGGSAVELAPRVLPGTGPTRQAEYTCRAPVRVSVSRHGCVCAVQLSDGHVLLWDTSTARNYLRLQHSRSYQGLALSPCGEHLARGAHGNIRVWDTRTGECTARLDVSRPGIMSDVQYSPCGVWLAGFLAGCGGVWLWQAQDARRARVVLHDAHITAGCVSASHVVCASEDMRIYVWGTHDTRDCRLTLTGHTGEITLVTVTPDERTLVTLADTHTVQELWLWCASTGARLRTVAPWCPDARVVAVSSEADVVVYCSQWRGARCMRRLSTGGWLRVVGAKVHEEFTPYRGVLGSSGRWLYCVQALRVCVLEALPEPLPQ